MVVAHDTDLLGGALLVLEENGTVLAASGAVADDPAIADGIAA